MADLKLTRKQYNAVNSNAGRIACIAGPGTGKTRTLITRIKRLLAEGVSASEILVLTFTNKAAQEVRERLESPDIMAGTFHSIFYQLIGKYLEMFKEFHPYIPTIYDMADEEDVIKETIESTLTPFKIGEAKAILIRKYQDLADNREFTAQEGIFLSEFEDKVIREGHALTFDMILWIFWKRLGEAEFLRNELRNRFRYVFVDEYQDTNKIQAELIRLLDPANLFVVGDLDQCLYSWRGAKLEELIRFTQQEGTETIFLDTSFRSRPEILLAAHKLICHNQVGFKKEIYSVKEPKDNSFGIKSFQDSDTETRGILAEVPIFDPGQAGTAGNGVLETIAILTRTNREAAEYSEALTKAGIDHLLLTTEQEIWNDFLIKNILAYLKLAVNPQNSHSLGRSLRVPVREWYNPRLKTEYHLEALKRHVPVIDIYREKHPEDLIFNFLKAVSPETPVFEALNLLCTKIGLTRKEHPTYKSILPNKIALIEQMIERVFRWSENVDDSRLKAFVHWLTFRDMQDKLLFENKRVLVMTLHGAKGLEFDRVIIPSVVENNLPSKRGDLEEERRLLYVGITRAKELTLLTYAIQKSFASAWGTHSTMKIVNQLPSRFIEELK